MSKKPPPPSKGVIFGFLGVSIVLAIIGVTLSVSDQGNIAFAFYVASIIALVAMIKKLQDGPKKKA